MYYNMCAAANKYIQHLKPKVFLIFIFFGIVMIVNEILH